MMSYHKETLIDCQSEYRRKNGSSLSTVGNPKIHEGKLNVYLEKW